MCDCNLQNVDFSILIECTKCKSKISILMYVEKGVESEKNCSYKSSAAKKSKTVMAAISNPISRSTGQLRTMGYCFSIDLATRCDADVT